MKAKRRKNVHIKREKVKFFFCNGTVTLTFKEVLQMWENYSSTILK